MLTLHLTDAEVEALKRAHPDLSAGDAAVVIVRAALSRRYRRDHKAGRLLNLPALKRAIEHS